MRTRNQNFFVLGACLFLLGFWTTFHRSAPVQPPVNAETIPQPVTQTLPSVRTPEPTHSPEREFQTFLNQTFNQLAQVKDIQLAPGTTLHDTPPETYRDSPAFGKIMDAVKANPAFVHLAMEFYERCALNAEVLLPTRAVCLAHFRYWMQKKGTSFEPKRYAPEVVRIAEKVPVVW